MLKGYIHGSLNGTEIVCLGVYVEYLIAFVQKALTQLSPYTARATIHWYKLSGEQHGDTLQKL